MWARPDMGCVVMCGYPWVTAPGTAAAARLTGALYPARLSFVRGVRTRAPSATVTATVSPSETPPARIPQ